MRRRLRFIILFATIFILVLSSACLAYGEDGNITINFNKTKTIMTVGSSMQLNLTSNTSGLSSSDLKWSSSNPSIVSVDNDGVFTSHTLGTAVITATSPTGDKASCTVTVKDYLYLAENDFVVIHYDYPSARARIVGAYAYTDVAGHDIVITLNYYSIINIYSQFKMYDFTERTVISDISKYFNRMIEKDSGRLRAYERYNEALEAQRLLLKGFGQYSDVKRINKLLNSDSETIQDLPAVKISKPKAAKKAVTVKWKKVSKKHQKKIQGIEIQVSTDSGFNNIVKSTSVGKKKTSKKIKGLKSKTKYWIRIRAYRIDTNGKHVSAWKKKTIKVK